MSRGLAVGAALAVLVLVGCGGAKRTTEGRTSSTTATSTVERERVVRVYFLLGGKVQPVLRVTRTEAVAGAALQALAQGPSEEERQSMGLRSAVPPGADFSGLRIDEGVASLDLPPTWERSAVAQVVYTLTQFPTVQAAEIRGQRYTRADFEDETPQILVESPLPFQTVRSPLRASGTANTFEATFQYELVDPQGTILAQSFVTASSGSGERGTFSFEVPFSATRSGLGKLVVFEVSAEDGSRIHEIAIPIRLEAA
ncbi:MAG: spore gernimation protein [Thermoleophilia bacterium]